MPVAPQVFLVYVQEPCQAYICAVPVIKNGI